MLLTYLDLVELVADGVLAPVAPSQINAASIDVRLGNRLLIEDPERAARIDLAKREVPPFVGAPLCADGCWLLHPGEFCLAHTREVFDLPADVCAEFKLKSSLARAGLGHALSGFCDPGWTGSVLTLGLRNDLQYNCPSVARGSVGSRWS